MTALSIFGIVIAQLSAGWLCRGPRKIEESSRNFRRQNGSRVPHCARDSAFRCPGRRLRPYFVTRPGPFSIQLGLNMQQFCLTNFLLFLRRKRFTNVLFFPIDISDRASTPKSLRSVLPFSTENAKQVYNVLCVSLLDPRAFQISDLKFPSSRTNFTNYRFRRVTYDR